MKEILKFNLKGLSGIIKKPESNEIYFTYNNIHKIAILGIIGSIIGENGYNYNSIKRELKHELKSELPEFYENLKNLQISVAHDNKIPIFTKKIQEFNNSVGYASKEEGNNLIVTEQWIENPNWNIYILDDGSQEYNKIKEYLINKKCEYVPYIGKNDHFANINNVEVLKGNKEINPLKIDSIFADIKYEISDNEELPFCGFEDEDLMEYEYFEILPTKLDSKIGYTDFKKFVCTNKNIKVLENIDNVYNLNEKNIYFF